MPETGTWQITTVADISLVITGTQGITKNTKISKKEVLQIVIYLVDAVLLGGIIFTLRLIYLRKKKIKKKQKMKPNQSLRNAGYSDVEISTDVDLQEVTGIVNHNYFVLELQEQPLQSTDTTINKETESPYVDTKDGIYDHLREHREKKVNEKNTSDEANKSISISDYPYTECVEVYDQLRDKIVSMEDYTEDIHNHVFATTSTASVHATADRCNQYKMHSTFDKVSNIRPDATYINLPHENGNNISERLDEDHPYFILTPQTNIIIKYVEKNH
ncbi:uncharacterized protein LOC134246593 [Saccostrea cucullata]|uniref:uncharacterized protein LOC134246593 n=1 Tax=Saccostrea cuccullata TaxID=36930 RepID=UPI002ED699FE